MLKRLSFTLTVIASLSGLYWMYALVVTPRLAPKMLTAQQRPNENHDELKFEPPPGNIQDAERYLPDALWAADATPQIAMANGVIYTNSWQLKDKKQNLYEFRPFAMIWFDTPDEGEADSDSRANKQPMTLVSDSGLVQFSSEFDPIKNRNYGRVIGGKLEGKVVAGGPDGLSIRGRDFFFYEKSLELHNDSPVLHSDSPVEFRFQQHHGMADLGFKADLLPSAESHQSNQLLAVSGFRRVLLRGHVEMNLANSENPLHVTCDEGFQFNPEQLVASFQGNANLQRLTASGQPDQLKGDNLDLFFKQDPARGDVHASRSRGDAPTIVPILRGHGPTGLSATGPTHDDLDLPGTRDTSAGNSGQLNLWELRMTGSRVELTSPSNGLTAFMTSLVYEVTTRTAKLITIPPVGKPAGSELKSVFVRHRPSATDLSCPRLQLTHDENGQVVSAHGDGRGVMRRRVPGSNEVEFSANWQSHFDLQRVIDTELDLLTLVGSAMIEQPNRTTSLEAEQIQLWYDRPTDMADAASIRANAGSTRKAAILTVNDAASRSVPDPATREFRPRQLQAQDNVVVLSPQMNAETKRFIVNFEDQSSSPGESADGPKSRPRVRQVAVSNTEVATKSKSKTISKNEKPNTSAEPLQFRSDLIRANVRLASASRQVADRDEPQAELTEVWTEGQVDLQQPREGGAEPLRLLGDRLHLRNASREGQQVLRVFGRPAMIRARGFDIEGQEVFLDRPNNRVWIEGAGELRMPVKNDPFDGVKLGSPTLLTVRWKEQMLFDGQTATFLDNVNAVLKDSRLQCEEMEVVLTERLSFRDDAGPATTAEVQRVICKDGVHVEQKLFVDDNPSEIRHGDFATLTLDQISGRMVAIGPGKINLWRPGQGKRAGLAPRAVAQANRPLESEVSNWEFTRVTFQGKTIGNLQDRQTKFQDRVHIVYGPVAHPLDTIDPDHLPKDGGALECDSLQILQIKPTGTQKPYIELEAKGNAKLEGRTFNARADEITFDESKELYTLRSTGNREVTIWRQTTPDGEPSEASAKSMRFIPSQNYLRSDRTTGIRGTN